MKKEITFRFCEYCNAQLSTESPPAIESYEAGRIELASSSTILLPQKVVDIRKTLHGESHAADICGWYCGPECLISHIRNIYEGKT